MRLTVVLWTGKQLLIRMRMLTVRLDAKNEIIGIVTIVVLPVSIRGP
jgi:hypothetical protein